VELCFPELPPDHAELDLEVAGEAVFEGFRQACNALIASVVPTPVAPYGFYMMGRETDLQRLQADLAVALELPTEQIETVMKALTHGHEIAIGTEGPEDTFLIPERDITHFFRSGEQPKIQPLQSPILSLRIFTYAELKKFGMSYHKLEAWQIPIRPF
jgi:hypothetical protein